MVAPKSGYECEASKGGLFAAFVGCFSGIVDNFRVLVVAVGGVNEGSLDAASRLLRSQTDLRDQCHENVAKSTKP